MGTRRHRRVAHVSLLDVAREVTVTPQVARAATGGTSAVLTPLIAEGGHDTTFGGTVEAVRACDEPRRAIATAVHGEPPTTVTGRDHLYRNFPPPVRWARTVLISRFRKTLKALAAPA